METVRLAVFAMGCRFELLLAGGSPASLRAAGEVAIEEIEEAHRRLSAFDAHSVVSRINAGAGRHAERVDREVLGLLDLCEEVRVASGGAFDITVGRVMETRGYRRSPEGSAAVCEARVGGLVIDRESSLVGLTDEAASIDLGGVGKGFGLDLAVRVLREAGVRSAFLHAGTSSVVSIGRRPDGEAWKVTLPSVPGGTPIDLVDSALSVSGTEVQGSHVMDPRTGEPARDARPVAVLGPSAAACDAWTTASFVLRGRPPGLGSAYRCMIETDTGWADAPAIDTGKIER